MLRLLEQRFWRYRYTAENVGIGGAPLEEWHTDYGRRQKSMGDNHLTQHPCTHMPRKRKVRASRKLTSQFSENNTARRFMEYPVIVESLDSTMIFKVSGTDDAGGDGSLAPVVKGAADCVQRAGNVVLQSTSPNPCVRFTYAMHAPGDSEPSTQNASRGERS